MNNSSPSNDSPLSATSVTLSTPGIGGQGQQPHPPVHQLQQQQQANVMSSSAGNPGFSPLYTNPTMPSSISATNSPLAATYHGGPGGNPTLVTTNTSGSTSALTMASSMPTMSTSMMSSSISTTNLSSMIGGDRNMTPATSTSPTPTMSLPQKEISVSCFEFLYIEMVEYIVKSSTDKTQISKKLEKLGFKVGHKLVEKLTIETQLYGEILDVVKFICKVFWSAVFKKSIDSLRTNHKGVFVLTDQKFQWLIHLSFDPNSTTKDCSEYVYFAIGLIKGAMANFGYKSTVTFEIQQMHSVVFTIKIET